MLQGMSRRLAVLIVGAAIVLALAPPARRVGGQPQQVRARVMFVTLGSCPEPLAQAVERGLRSELQVDVQRFADVPLQQAAYYPPRRRYRAERLLDFLRGRLADQPPSTRALGMTEVDISTTK